MRNRLNRVLWLMVVNFCIYYFGYSQNFSTPVLVNNDAPGSAERSPIMRIGLDDNIYISWIKASDGANGDIYFTSSTDEGNSFRPATRITQGAKVNSNFQRAAEFVVDTKGIIHLAWLENKFNNQTDIWYIRSTDKGVTWTQPMNVVDSDDSSKYVQDFCSIAVDSTDRLYISFLDNREQRRKNSTNMQLYLTTSTDGGDSWSKNKKVNNMLSGIGGTCECCKQDIEVSPEGHVYLAFRSNINNRRDIWVARSIDAGQTFDDVILIQDGVWTINACPVTGPNIALDKNENLHCVWRDNRDVSGVQRIYYSCLPKDSNASTKNVQLSMNSSMSPNYPNIAVAQNFNLAITYQTNDKGMRYYCGGTPQTDFEDVEMLASNGNKEFSNILFSKDGTRYICWQDSRRDIADIYFAKENSVLTSVVSENQNNENELFVYPNPVTSESIISFQLLKDENIKLDVYNILGNNIIKIYDGKECSGEHSYNMPNLQNGMYFIRLNIKDKVLAKKIIIDNNQNSIP